MHRLDCGYPVFIGKDLFGHIPPFVKGKALVVYDKKVVEAAKQLEKALFEKKIPSLLLALDVSEELKSFEGAQQLYTLLIENHFSRESTLISLGGGVLGDLVGFVASTYLRGIFWINVATTLLSQADSCIGGKVGINHPLAKNAIGSIFQPRAVFCPLELLNTLDKRERVSGLSEIIKHGLILDLPLFSSLESNWEDYLSLSPTRIQDGVIQSLTLKRDVILKDERETKGIRTILNFGHTFGHAFEAATGYTVLRHGEAVILGMRVALTLSVLKGHLCSNVFDRVDAFLQKIAVPHCSPVHLSDLIAYTARDKKIKNGNVEYVLLKEIGKPILDQTISESVVKEAFSRLHLPQVAL
jgi:3-dehydroquinate synthase